MQRCEDNVAARLNGNALQPLSDVSVTVTDDHTGLPAALYSDNGVTQVFQPLKTDDNGYYGFYAANGEYTLTFTGIRIATFTRKIVLNDPDDNPVVTKAALAAGSGSTLVTFTQTPTQYAQPRSAQDKLSVFVDDLDFSGTFAEKLNYAFQFVSTRTGGAGGEVKVPAGAKRTIQAGEVVNFVERVSLTGCAGSYSGAEIAVLGKMQFSGTGTNGEFCISGLTISADGNTGNAIDFAYFREISFRDVFVYHAKVNFTGFSYLNLLHYKQNGGGVTCIHDANQLSESPRIHMANFSDAYLNVANTTDIEISGSRFLGAGAWVKIVRGNHNANLFPMVDLSNVILDSQDGVPLWLAGVSPRASNLFISGGRVSLAPGLYMDDCTEGSFKGFTSRFNGDSGVEMHNCRNIDFTGTHLNDNKVAGAKLFGTNVINFYGGSARNAARWYGGNYVQQQGIVSPDGTALNTLVDRVDLRTNAATAIYLPDASNLVRNALTV